MYMADYSSMKAPELRELLKERGVKANLTRVLKPILKKMAEEGLMDVPKTPGDKLVDVADAVGNNRTQLIEKIKKLRPDMTGLTRKSADDLNTILKDIGTAPVKQDGKYWVEEAKKLGFKGMTLRKKKDELAQLVTDEKKRREEESDEDYKSAEEEPKKDKLTPSLEAFKIIARQDDSQNNDEDLFLKILIAMELFKVLIKRSPYGKEFTLKREGKPAKTIDVKPVKKSLQYYLNEMKKTFAKATKDWKIKDVERNKMRKEAEEAMKTDKQIYDGIKNIIVGEGDFSTYGMSMTLEELGDVYYLRTDEDDPQSEWGGYEGGEDFMGSFIGFEEGLDDLEYYNLEDEEPKPDPFVSVPKPPPADPDRIKPLELEEGQDWKTLTVPNKVKYFLSLVPYEAESMGQIERQSQAKIDRFIERARYDAGLDEEEPMHYFVDWNSYANYENGVNIFDETQWRRADSVPTLKDVERQPNIKGRFFKGVFFDDDVEYIVNYFGMFAVKDELEKEIQENTTRFDWIKLSSWVKYKRFNFWRRPIVLKMTKGPMMIVPPYNIYDIRQSTSGVRPIDGVFEFYEGGQGRHPDDFESIQEQLVESYTKNLPDSDDEDYDSAEEEIVRFPKAPWDLVKDFMLDTPDDKQRVKDVVARRDDSDFAEMVGWARREKREKREKQWRSMLYPPNERDLFPFQLPKKEVVPPNEQKLLPDPTPPVEKEEVVEVDVAPPGEYNRFGDLLPAGILPPDEDAQVSPMVSVYGDSDIPRDFVGDWGLDFKGLTTVFPIINDELPEESGIIWLFAEIVNREDPTETNFIAACEDNKVSGFNVKFEERPDSVYDINTGEFIGTLDREDGKLNFERDNFGGSSEFKEMKVRKITLNGRTYFIDNDNDAIYDGKTFEVVGDVRHDGEIRIEKGFADYRTVLPVLPKKPAAEEPEEEEPAAEPAAEEPAAEPAEEPRVKSKKSSKLNKLLAKKKKEKSGSKIGVFKFLTGQLPEEPRRRPDGTLEGSLG